MINAIMLILIFRTLEAMGAVVPIWFYIICWLLFAINALGKIIKICKAYVELLEEKRKKEVLEKLEDLKKILDKERTKNE